MKKLGILALAAATAMLLGVALGIGSGSAVALSNAERECAELGEGYTYTKDGSEAKCVGPEEKVGNQPPHSNGQTTQTTETGKGNLKKSEPVCEGPPGQCAK